MKWKGFSSVHLLQQALCKVCVFCQVDAIAYYSAKEKDLLLEFSKEAELAPQRHLGIAFVTLQTEAMAK